MLALGWNRAGLSACYHSCSFAEKDFLETSPRSRRLQRCKPSHQKIKLLNGIYIFEAITETLSVRLFKGRDEVSLTAKRTNHQSTKFAPEAIAWIWMSGVRRPDNWSIIASGPMLENECSLRTNRTKPSKQYKFFFWHTVSKIFTLHCV